jgi:hypothetical protein
MNKKVPTRGRCVDIQHENALPLKGLGVTSFEVDSSDLASPGIRSRTPGKTAAGRCIAWSDALTCSPDTWMYRENLSETTTKMNVAPKVKFFRLGQ